MRGQESEEREQEIENKDWKEALKIADERKGEKKHRRGREIWRKKRKRNKREREKRG